MTEQDWRLLGMEKEMRRTIKHTLRGARAPGERLDALAESIVDLLKRRRGS